MKKSNNGKMRSSTQAFLLKFILPVLSVFVYSPLIMFLMAIRCPKAASNVLHNWAHLVFNSVKMHCDIKGLENIDPDKRYIIISNHGSMLDIPALVLVSPDICSWVMKKELMRIPVLNLMFATGMGIPIARANARKSQEKMIRMVKKIKKRVNPNIIVYPEGTRTKDGAMIKFKRGFVQLVKTYEMDVLPVTLNGLVYFYSKLQKNPNPDSKIEIIVHPPMLYKDIKDIPDKEIAGKAYDIVSSVYYSLRGCMSSILNTYQLHLKNFEGPLELLDELIGSAKLDITEIALAQVTEQYCSYIKTMREFNIDLASEFFTVAATLINIKSRRLLPQIADDSEDEIKNEQELLRRLKDLRLYKKLAQKMEENLDKGSVYFTRGKALSFQDKKQDTEIDELTIGDLFRVVIRYRGAFRHNTVPLKKRLVTPEQKIENITFLLGQKSQLLCSEIMNNELQKYDKVAAFLGITEMTKSQKINVIQNHFFEDFTIVKR